MSHQPVPANFTLCVLNHPQLCSLLTPTNSLGSNAELNFQNTHAKYIIWI